MNKIIVVSRYNEDVSWINDYNYDYIIYNKGEHLDNYNQKICENIGNNQRDIFQYIYENYDKLPDYMVFLQGNPYDHLTIPLDFQGDVDEWLKDKLNQFISKQEFICIENYDFRAEGLISRVTDGFEEYNNSWYISEHNISTKQTCKWSTFNQFMNEIFMDYEPNDWIRFTPGSQYLITKEIALHYSREFWKYLMDILCENNMTEGHVIERALLIILKCKLTPYIK